MCRIFGIAYNDKSEREVLDAAEIASVLYPSLIHQGPHAWGWMSYNDEAPELGIEHSKFPGRCDSNTAADIQLGQIDPTPNWLVGHLRYATHGKPEDNRNNHPIPHGDVIGVHNGVLRNHDTILRKTGREDPKTLVDSEAIFAAVNRWGAKKGLAKIEGDMVAIYANRERPHVLHIARTHGRQLTIGWTVKGNLIFASEEQALRKLEPEIEFRKFSTISENRLLVVRNGKIITRLTFREPIARYVPPTGSIIVPTRRTPTVARATESVFAANRNAERASSRGEKIFGNVRTSEERREQGIVSKGKKKGRHGKREVRVTGPTEIVEADGSAPKRTAPNQNQKLYYWGGELLTHEEYEDALEADRIWLEGEISESGG